MSIAAAPAARAVRTPSLPGVLSAYATLWALTALVAGAARLAGVEHRPTPSAHRHGSLHETLTIVATNARLAIILLAGAALVARARAWRPMLDAAIGALLVVNVGTVGVAIAVHGAAIAPWLVHLPLEWAGFAIATAAYGQARSAPLCWSQLQRYALAAAAALTLAATVESFLVPL